MKVLLTEDEARRLLDGFLGELRACLLAGWNTWRDLGEQVPGHRIKFGARSRASIIHDAIVDDAWRRFYNVPGVNRMKSRGLLVLVFGGVLVLRFKKFRSPRFKTSGIRTEQAQRFSKQLSLELQGLSPEATNVVAGYLLTELQDEYQSMWVVCSNDSEIEWKIPLTGFGPSPAMAGAGAPTPQRPPVRSAIVEDGTERTEGN